MQRVRADGSSVFETLGRIPFKQYKGSFMKLATTGIARTMTLAALLVWAASATSYAQSAFSDQKLEAFVAAAVAVTELSEQWRQRIGDAGSEEKANALREQANQELVAAVEGTDGITVQEYKDISDAARGDPELSAKIRQIYDQQATD